MNNFICKNQNKLYGIFVFLIATLYAGVLSLHHMPLPDGWYPYYAQCILNGEYVYKDFQYLFPPLYIYFIAGIVKIFGAKMIVMRILGVIFFGIIAVLLYLICKEICNKGYVGCVAAVTSVLYIQTESAQVFYDYIRFMDIFSLTSCLFLIKSVKQMVHEDYILVGNACWLGVSIACFCLVKQNMGMIFFAYSFALIFALGAFKFVKYKNVKKFLSVFVSVFVLCMCIAMLGLYCTDSLNVFLHSGGSEAMRAKGGIMAILFGWIIRMPDVLLIYKSQIIVLLILCILLRILSRHHEYSLPKTEQMFLGGVFACAVLFCLLLLVFYGDFAHKVEWNFYFSPYLVFVVDFEILLMCFLKSARETITFITALGAYFAISYGCGTSGGLAEGEAGIGLAMLILFIFSGLQTKMGIWLQYVFVIICVIFSAQFMDRKMLHTYYWWGSDESTFWQAEYKSRVPKLEYLLLSKETRDLYDGIYKDVLSNTTADDAIFCFPRIPIFYVLCDRTDPGVYAKVQWFDVSSSTALDDDLKTIQCNLPKCIILMNTSEEVYESHEMLFNNNKASEMRHMRDSLQDLIAKKYRFVNEYKANSNIVSIYVLKEGVI